MKIRYQFVTETMDVDVPEEWGKAILEFDRQEYNNDHAESRRHVSLDSMDYEGDVFADPNDTTGKTEAYIELARAIGALHPLQQELLRRVYSEGQSVADIAKAEGVSRAAIHDRLNRILKTLKNNMP